MTANYPIMLRLEGKIVVVVGGGKVAERKVAGLLGKGARVHVISPEVTEELRRLVSEGMIVWLQKSFSENDMKEAFMIFAATNDEELNRLVKNSASEHQLVTVADDPEGSDFHVPSHLQRGRLSIAISTGGASPTLAGKIRKQLEEQFDDSYEAYLEFLFKTRQWILKEVGDSSLKRKLLTAIVTPRFLSNENRDEEFRRLYEELM
ncbi:NAD(P)-binding protein [Neobacillus pocheonensis]|uniref:precorrin-2 dehydrogenase n=1 Tax=Neobacillus pocheonensis TaxID=363869 RepID=A0ABT0WJG5_9BACI|nr:NAD(P)-binding protein [Neobacillus pocheonensis]